MLHVLLGLSLVAATSACGSHAARPQDPSADALHRDLERLVEIAGTEGWSIDRTEIEEALPSALLSVCRTTSDTQDALLRWLDARIAAEGGPVEQAYRDRGRSLRAVEDLLSLTRIRMLLSSSMERKEADCPFWLEPRQRFVGRQILDDRWFLSVGGGGKGLLVRQSGENDLNFGGAGRFLVGRAFGRHATLLTGLQSGGSAAFPVEEDGTRGNLAVTVDAIVPLVYRHRLVNSYWEIEGGYLAHLTEGSQDLAHGLHIGMALGGTTSRRRWFFPGAAFGIGYDRIAEDKVRHVISLGFRVAIDIAH